MTSSATYVTVNGMLFSEVRDGVETIYVPDPLGGLAECRDSAGNTTYTADYWPFGQLRTSTGTNPSQWGFCGLLGYLTDTAKRLYVRARDLDVMLGRWLEVDPLWPGELAYVYANSSPVKLADPSGMKIELCRRPIQWWLPCGLWQEYSHWWLKTDQKHCFSIGYGPRWSNDSGIRTDDFVFNEGPYSGSERIHCVLIEGDSWAEKCLCARAKYAKNCNKLCDTTWCDDPRDGDYNLLDHNCQDFVFCLLSICGLKLPWNWGYYPTEL